MLAPATGLAQQTDIGFTIGYYNPIGALVESGDKSMPATYFQQRLQGTPALGGNITLWTSDHWGFAASFNVSPSDVAVTDTSGTHDHSSTVLLASARAIYAFTPLLFKAPPGKRELPWSFYVGAGLGSCEPKRQRLGELLLRSHGARCSAQRRRADRGRSAGRAAV